MDRYISIPEKIEAFQWLPPMKSDIIEKEFGCGYVTCPICKGSDSSELFWFVKNGLSHIYVNYSDYVIKYPDGKLGVMNADLFHKKYQKIKKIEPLKK